MATGSADIDIWEGFDWGHAGWNDGPDGLRQKLINAGYWNDANNRWEDDESIREYQTKLRTSKTGRDFDPIEKAIQYKNTKLLTALLALDLQPTQEHLKLALNPAERNDDYDLSVEMATILMQAGVEIGNFGSNSVEGQRLEAAKEKFRMDGKYKVKTGTGQKDIHASRGALQIAIKRVNRSTSDYWKNGSLFYANTCNWTEESQVFDAEKNASDAIAHSTTVTPLCAIKGAQLSSFWKYANSSIKAQISSQLDGKVKIKVGDSEQEMSYLEAAFGDPDKLELFLQNDANPNVESADGKKTLWEKLANNIEKAGDKSKKNMYIVAAKVFVNVAKNKIKDEKDRKADQMLFGAVDDKNWVRGIALLEMGIDPNPSDPARGPILAETLTALSMEKDPATKGQIMTFAQSLIQYGTQVEGDKIKAALATIESADPKRAKKIKELIVENMSAKQKDVALKQAIKDGRIGDVKILAAQMVSPERDGVLDPGECLNEYLVYAAGNCNKPEIAEALCDAGARIGKCRGGHKETELISSIDNGNAKMAAFFMDKNNFPQGTTDMAYQDYLNAKDDKNWTAAHAAAYLGDIGSLKLDINTGEIVLERNGILAQLKLKGADMSAVTSKQETIAYIAAKRDHMDDDMFNLMSFDKNLLAGWNEQGKHDYPKYNEDVEKAAKKAKENEDKQVKIKKFIETEKRHKKWYAALKACNDLCDFTQIQDDFIWCGKMSVDVMVESVKNFDKKIAALKVKDPKTGKEKYKNKKAIARAVLVAARTYGLAIPCAGIACGGFLFGYGLLYIPEVGLKKWLKPKKNPYSEGR